MDTVPSNLGPAEPSPRKPRFDRYDGSEGCPLEAALEIISGKWKGLVLYHLLDGKLRFTQIKRLAGDVTQRTLTRQLRELEVDGMVTRTVHPVVPPKVEYALTPKAEALRSLLLDLRRWGIDHALKSGQPTHPARDDA